MQQVAGAPMPMPARRRTIGLAFGGALVAGGLVGALVMAAVGDFHSNNASVSTTQPTQQSPLNNGGGFGGRFGGGLGGIFGNGGGNGTGSGSGSSSSGNANIDAASIAAKVDPALVDITSYLADGEAAGTGMIITSGGHVLTNNHVVEGATRVTATMVSSGKTYNVTILGTDPSDDVALLQLQGASNLKTVSIGDPSKVQVGDPIVAIGNALGAGGTPATATGQVVGVGQTITATDDTGANPETLQNLIQINADVQPGDSGGPLVNAQGQVIGMDTAASSSGRGFRFNNVAAQGFAIPIDAAMNDAQGLHNGGGSGAQTAFLGVGIDSTSTGNGASVVEVEPGTPAASAGLVTGDTITGFAGKSIPNGSALSTAVKAEKPGDKVQVTWNDTNGSSHSANVTLAGQGTPAA
jgi:S1-C subfamily serine protease